MIGKGPQEAEKQTSEVHYHEAGHAVFAYLAGKRIKYVQIGEEPECVSWSAYIPGESGTLEVVAETLIGQYAEYRAATGELMKAIPFDEFYAPVDEIRRTGKIPESLPSDDAQVLFRFLLPLKREKAKDVYCRACIRAAAVTISCWPAIEAVANRLLEVGYLEGAEVDRVIEATLSR